MIDYNQLNPGIRETVRLLNIYGFNTTDSGDGVTNPALQIEGALTISNVAMTTSRALLLEEADRLWTILQSFASSTTGVAIEASYSPVDKHAVILLLGFNDTMIKGRHNV